MTKMNTLRKAKHGLILTAYNDIHQGLSINQYGEYCENQIHILSHFVKKNFHVVDVGACFGYFTLPFSKMVGKNGRVTAIEPHRHNFYILVANTVLNKCENVNCLQLAVGSKSRELIVAEINSNIQDNFGAYEISSVVSKSGYHVSMHTIDEMQLPKIDFLKIHTGGSELQVLHGCQKTIEKHKPFIYVNYDFEEQNPEIKKFLKSCGYDLYLSRTTFFNPKNFFKKTKNYFSDACSENLICFREKQGINIKKLDIEKL